MKKSFLLLLLTLCMVLCFAAFTASAEETEHVHCYCNGTVSGNDAHTCESVTWIPISEALKDKGLTVETADFGKLPSGNYYLDADVTVNKISSIGSITVQYKLNDEGKMLDKNGNVTTDTSKAVVLDRTVNYTREIAICLNGHNITSTASRVFGALYFGSKLVITDCSGKQTDGVWTWDGTVEGSTSSTGTLLYTYAGSTFEIYGGNFVAREGVKANYGLFCISSDSGKEADGKEGWTDTDKAKPINATYFNLFNGNIVGGHAIKNGGSFAFWHNAQVNMYGGSITGGHADANGGNITISGGGTDVKILGGTISGGTLGENGYGADIHHSNGKLTLDSTFGTLYYTNAGSDVSITLGANFSAEKVLVDSAVTKTQIVTIVSTYDNYKQVTCFEAKDEADTLYANKKVDDKNVVKLVQNDVVGDGKHYSCNCGGAYASYSSKVGHTACTIKSSWKDLGAYLAEQNIEAGAIYEIPAGSYYLSADLTLNHYLKVLKDTTVYIDLNGYTLTGGAQPSGNTPLLRTEGKAYLYIVDSSYDASATTIEEAFKGAIAVSGGNSYPLMYANGSSIVRVYGGKMIYTGEQHKTGLIATSGEIRMFNGYINGGKSTGNGASIVVYDSGKVTMYGGQITGGESATNGGNIYVDKDKGAVTIYDGIISNGKAAKGGNIYASRGTVTIEGGLITEGHATERGGNIYIHGGWTTSTDSGNTSFVPLIGKLIMKGGVVSNGTAGKLNDEGMPTSGSGGNVTIFGQYATQSIVTDGVTSVVKKSVLATFTMTGGTISGGKAYTAGNVDAYGTMVMDGGLITDGTAGNEGGNMRVYYVKDFDAEGKEFSATSFTMNGGEITKGYAAKNGGNLLTYGITNLNGGKLTNGVADSSAGNLRPFRPAVVTVGENFVISGGKSNKGGANIAIGGSASEEAGAWPFYAYLTIKGTVIDGNATDSVGDNVYASSDYTILTIDGATITGGTDTDLYFADNSKLTLKGNTTIGKLHLTNDSKQDVNATDLTSTTPISLICDKAGAFASATTDKTACFTNDMGREITFVDGKLHIGNANIVYVSNDGKDTYAGTEAAPFKTIKHAIAMVKDEGTVSIVGTADVSEFTKSGKHITLTGGELNITNASRIELMDHIHFKNMTLTMPDGEFYFYCSGFTTIIDQDVTVRYLNKDTGAYSDTNTTLSQSSALLAGTRAAYENDYGKINGTDLTVLSGTWGHIYGGNNNCVLNGDVHLTVGGNVNKNLNYATAGHVSSTNGYNRVFGGSRYLDSSVTINGTVYLNITGGKYNSVFGGSNGGAEGDTITAVEMKISGGEGMAAYGAGARIAHTIGTVNFYYEGGTFEQVFGGALSRALTGDVNMYVTGGKITRRLYGGCYNEVSSSGEWSNQYAVTGNINLYIGEGATITCDLDDPSATGLEAILTGGKYTDRGIYGHSRRGDATTSDAENATIIFLTKAAYDKNSNNLTAVDSIMAGIMRGVPCADLLFYYDNWVAENNRIAREAVAVKDPATNKAGDASAYTESVSMTLPEAPVYYTGKALEPATLTVSENWNYEAPVMTYADNTEIGTATVTLTANGYTVTATFDIVKKAEVAEVNGKQYEYLQDAVNAVAEGGYMLILIDCDEPITISKDIYIDLNGCKLTGKVTVAEGATLYGADATTDDYDCSNGYGEITNVEGKVASQYKATLNGKIRRYVTYTDSTTGAKSFHRIYLGVTSVTLRPGASGLGYKATIAGDAKVVEMMAQNAVSMTMWVEGMEDKAITQSKNMEGNRMIVSALVRGMDVSKHSELNLIAKVSVTVNGETLETNNISATLKSAILAVAKAIDGGATYTDAQMSALYKLCNAHVETVSAWGEVMNNILSWTPATT